MGRDAKYTDEEREAQGNPGAERKEPAPLAALVPDSLAYAPPPPEWLVTSSDTGAMAANAWRAIAQLLVEARALRESDLHSLARFCRYAAEWVTLTDTLDNEGFTITNTTKFGESTVAHPAIAARRAIEQAMQGLERELGLSPRSRIDVQKRLMASLRDLPGVGKQVNPRDNGGPIGMLSDDSED